MTLQQASKRASDRAKATRSERWIVWSVEDQDAPHQHYHIATYEDLEYSYVGSEVVAEFGPDGRRVCD